MIECIKNHLNTKCIGNNIIFEECMESTNTCAKKIAEENVMHGTVVATLRQTAGRGRRGRNWISPEGNCYFSVLLRPDVCVENVSMLTLVAALSVAETIESLTGLDVGIKWPNDIVVNGKKLCGILTESSMDLNGLKYVVIGVGVNANQEMFDEEIEDMATSLFLESRKRVDCAKLIAECLNCMEGMYETFIETEDMSMLMGVYNDLLVNKNKEVRIIDQEVWNGVALGINEKGELLVKTLKGETISILAGEVSVRGLYGYI